MLTWLFHSEEDFQIFFRLLGKGSASLFLEAVGPNFFQYEVVAVDIGLYFSEFGKLVPLGILLELLFVEFEFVGGVFVVCGLLDFDELFEEFLVVGGERCELFDLLLLGGAGLEDFIVFVGLYLFFDEFLVFQDCVALLKFGFLELLFVVLALQSVHSALYFNLFVLFDFAVEE
jgi:hypothetical protein